MKNHEKILSILSLSFLIIIGITLVFIIIDRSWYELQGSIVWVFGLCIIILLGIVTILTGFLSKNKNLLKLGGILLGYALVTFLVNRIDTWFEPMGLLTYWINLIITSLLIFLIQKNVWNFKKNLNEPK